MSARKLCLGTCALGRAIDADGDPLDGREPLRGRRLSPEPSVPHPLARAPVGEPFWTGVRAIDGTLTFGRGARIGIFGPPGTGKSRLLQTIVENASADAIVVALIGERGCEAQRWIEAVHVRATVVCETSDRPPARRVRAARTAMAQACALRARGLHVLLAIDSLARVAAALRERALAAGEAAGRAGYPPSVFSQLAALVECAGTTRCGSITLVASVLDDEDDRDPVGEAARSLLDGHITLSEKLAGSGRFPAIDVPKSLSRTQPLVLASPHLRHAARVRGALASLEQIEEARAFGMLPAGAAERAAIAAEDRLAAFLRQGTERSAPAETLSALAELADMLGEPHGYQ